MTMMDVSKSAAKPSGTLSSVVGNFNSRFNIIQADTTALLETVYRLRYQVYCRERNFEDPNAFAGECERDDYDSRSVHSLLFDRSSRSFVGTVRLILPHHHAPENSFPIQKLAPATLRHKAGTPHLSAEISRFAISKEYRRQAPECWEGSNSFGPPCSRDNDQRVTLPYGTLGLIRAVIQMSLDHGIDDLFAVMEPALLRLLSRCGIYFRPIGPLVEYRGMRQPCHSNLQMLLSRLNKERTDVWEVITDEGRLLKRLEMNIPHYRNQAERQCW